MIKKIAFLFVLIFMFVSAGAQTPVILFISPEGNNSNIGSKQAPFATPERARDEIRKLRAKGALGSVTVFLRGGVYRLSRPFVLSPEDSGTETNPVVYRAFEKEKVIFSGSLQFVPKWKRYDDHLFVTKINFPVDQGFSPRNLYIDSQAYPLARYPNLDEAKKPFGGVAADCLSPSRIAKWKTAEGGYVHGMQHGKWGSIHYEILEKTETGYPHLELVSINTSTMYNGAQLHLEDRFVENIFEELDAPGEWFWDKKTELLYFYPTPEMQLENAMFEVPCASSLVQFRGTQKSPVRHVQFQDINFERTSSTWYLTTEHLPVGDYVIYRGATVYLEGTENCSVSDCSFTQIGGNGAMLSNYNRNSSVTGCRFYEVQGNGVVLVGSRDAMRDSPWCTVLDQTKTIDLSQKWGYLLTYQVWDEPLRDEQPSLDTIPGPKTENYPRYCRVENNLINRTGELEQQTAGILLSMCAENQVNHNTIFDLPRAGICINDGCWGGNVIADNDVFHTVLTTADHGPFNSWGRDRHWTMKMHGVVKVGDEKAHGRSRLDTYIPNVIRHNRFAHDISSHSWGIDLDDGSSNYHIFDNLTVGCSVKLREGFYRTVENNIFIGRFPPGKHVCFDQTEDIIRKNIYVNTEGSQIFMGIYCKPSQVKEMDNNLYYIPSGEPATIALEGGAEKGYAAKMNFDEWQKKGHDQHSLIADPLFVDFAKGDFRLKKNSPAFQMGFKEFPLDNFGVTKPELKKEAELAHQKFDVTLVLKRTSKSQERLYHWMEATLKTMTTDDEKSVAGIDDIKGVILISVPEWSPLSKSGARAGDVILKANETEIKTVDDLKRVLETKPGTLILWVEGNPPAHQLNIQNPKMVD